jgi:LAO/AO transport system kinase
MRDLAGDPHVFIRSMATRGSLGGLAQSTANMVQVFDAAGFDVIIIETVGAGQSEVDVARLAHTTLVVEAPGLGDDIQAIKAGILEIADILVINKADRPGVEITEKALKSMLDLAHPTEHIFQHHGIAIKAAVPRQAVSSAPLWIPPIQQTVATQGKGIVELAESIAKHRAHLTQSGGWAVRERARLEVELDALIHEELVSRFRQNVPQKQYEIILEKIIQRELSPGEAVRILMDGRSK